VGVVIGLGRRASDQGADGMIEDRAILFERGWHTAMHVTGLRYGLNKLRYAASAPIPGARFSVSPNDIRERYFVKGNDEKRIGHWQSGRVVPGDWDLSRRPFHRSLKFQACAHHFRDGKPWAATKAVPYGLKRIAKQGKYDNCRTEEELIARYASLDSLWEKTRQAGSLPREASHETTPRTGILVHIDRNGELLFGNQGFHRLAIAKLAQVGKITVVLGIVHPDALQTDIYKQQNAASR
jgi:uncharacterized protein YbdZ (MbtH family)